MMQSIYNIGVHLLNYCLAEVAMTPTTYIIKVERTQTRAVTTSSFSVNPQARPAAFGTLNILLTTASLGLTSLSSLNQGTRHLLVGDVDTSLEYTKDGPHSVLHNAWPSLYI